MTIYFHRPDDALRRFIAVREILAATPDEGKEEGWMRSAWNDTAGRDRAAFRMG